jgi:hypothetical protein
VISFQRETKAYQGLEYCLIIDSSITTILRLLNTRTGYLLPATKTVITTFLKYFCVVGFAKIAFRDSGHKYGEKLFGQQLC